MGAGASFAVDVAGGGCAAPGGADGDVAVDHGTLRVVDMGLRGTGYSVRLSGAVDGAWIRCFQSVQSDSLLYSRFVLEARPWSVWFLRRADDGPADVISALQTLDEMVARVNRFAPSL